MIDRHHDDDDDEDDDAEGPLSPDAGTEADEFELARARRDRRRPRGTERRPTGTQAFVGKVISETADIQVGPYLRIQKAHIHGTPSEGNPGLILDTTRSTLAYLLGPGTPAPGDYLPAFHEGNRWVVQRAHTRGGSGVDGVPLPGCFCSPGPVFITMTSDDEACNYRMFQSCTLAWYSPIPAGFEGLDLGTGAYLSTEPFPDPVDHGALFYYLLTCQFNQITLTRVYQESDYGSPFRDGVLYSWLLGNPANTCHPFHLEHGVAYPGSDQSCNVHLDGGA